MSIKYNVVKHIDDYMMHKKYICDYNNEEIVIKHIEYAHDVVNTTYDINDALTTVTTLKNILMRRENPLCHKYSKEVIIDYINMVYEEMDPVIVASWI